MDYFIKKEEEPRKYLIATDCATKGEFAFNLVKMRKKTIKKYQNCTLTSHISTAILQLQNNRLRNVVKQKQS